MACLSPAAVTAAAGLAAAALAPSVPAAMIGTKRSGSRWPSTSCVALIAEIRRWFDQVLIGMGAELKAIDHRVFRSLSSTAT